MKREIGGEDGGKGGGAGQGVWDDNAKKGWVGLKGGLDKIFQRGTCPKFKDHPDLKEEAMILDEAMDFTSSIAQR